MAVFAPIAVIIPVEISASAGALMSMPNILDSIKAKSVILHSGKMKFLSDKRAEGPLYNFPKNAGDIPEDKELLESMKNFDREGAKTIMDEPYEADETQHLYLILTWNLLQHSVIIVFLPESIIATFTKSPIR